MKKTYTNPFPYFAGIRNLQDVAPKDARVCVMNILGNESRKVTPVSHAFSGGNVVAGVQYGRYGSLETPVGDIPVYPRLAEVMKHHPFDTGVIYLPPSAVFHAVTELLHYNKKLKRIVIVTEKMSVKDQLIVREICQANKVDVFGANSLGVGDSWNKVRIGGALGGDKPENSLLKGSIAIHSNSGNFGNTIASYLKTSGFGTTTIVSSGKDKIIQFALPEFLYAAQNDRRTKAVVLYVEPGGRYEQNALDMIKEGVFKFTKPMIVCVTGRWKSNLTRAVGHAGALAGDGDDAESKEKWFDAYFKMQAFDPEKPERVSKKGIRVSSIQHIPLAVEAVFEKRGWEKDFKPVGDLSLKPWMGKDFGFKLPPHLKLNIVKAMKPYDEEIEKFNKELGATYLRQRMRNASGASRIDPATQIAELHGMPVVDLVTYPYESNMIFALIKQHPNKEDLPLVNACLNYLSSSDDIYYKAIRFAEENGATPNEALMAAVSMIGDHEQFRTGKMYIKSLLDIFTELGVKDRFADFDFKAASELAQQLIPTGKFAPGTFARMIIRELKEKVNKSNIIQFALHYIESHKVEDCDMFLLSAILTDLAFEPLALKKISRNTVEDMVAYLGTEARTTVLAGINPLKNTVLRKIRSRRPVRLLKMSFTETAFMSVFNRPAQGTELQEFQALLALTLTNGVGTLSAKGAKESVSAKNNISTTFAGFMSNTGLAHGGAGFDAVDFLMKSFSKVKFSDPARIPAASKIKLLSDKVALEYLEYKQKAKAEGKTSYDRIPCINHPVFKGKPVNIDPREDYIYKYFKNLKINNVFWEFYHQLVHSLYETGVSSNVYCVNIDAVIAVISLKLMWFDYKNKQIGKNDMQKIGFIIFLLGRMAGVAAEIADHRDRGLDMDCRTPVSETKFVM
jgi:succinyl-CoA synthetase alpha subunit/citrate synthase